MQTMINGDWSVNQETAFLKVFKLMTSVVSLFLVCFDQEIDKKVRNQIQKLMKKSDIFIK